MARESVPNREEVNPQWQESETPMARKSIHNEMRGNPQVHRCMGAFMRFVCGGKLDTTCIYYILFIYFISIISM